MLRPLLVIAAFLATVTAQCTLSYDTATLSSDCLSWGPSADCTVTVTDTNYWLSSGSFTYTCDSTGVITSDATPPATTQKFCSGQYALGVNGGDCPSAASLADFTLNAGSTCAVTVDTNRWYFDPVDANTYTCTAGADTTTNDATFTATPSIDEYAGCRLFSLYTGLLAGDCEISNNVQKFADGTCNAQLVSGGSCTYTTDANFQLVGDSVLSYSCFNGVISPSTPPVVAPVTNCQLPAIFPPGINPTPTAKQIAAARPSADAVLCTSSGLLNSDGITNPTSCFFVLKTGYVVNGGNGNNYVCDAIAGLEVPNIVKTGNKPRSLKTRIFN